jgi:hypothetical protein
MIPALGPPRLDKLAGGIGLGELPGARSAQHNQQVKVRGHGGIDVIRGHGIAQPAETGSARARPDDGYQRAKFAQPQCRVSTVPARDSCAHGDGHTADFSAVGEGSVWRRPASLQSVFTLHTRVGSPAPR